MFIGILGGSFNPIHNGHLHIATSVYHKLALDRVIFIPTGDPPHKPPTSLAPAHHRVAMVELAIQDRKNFALDDREARSGTISYSIDTISQLQREFSSDSKLGFIIGLDAFLEFQTWKQAGLLLDRCHMIVCSRPGASFTQLQSLSILPAISPLDLQRLDRHELEQLDIPLPAGNAVTLLSLPPCEVSASHIREQLALHQPVRDWLPPLVESYIIQHQVYQ